MTHNKVKTAGFIALKVLFTLCLLGTMVFIFFQSSRVGAVSSELSLQITEHANAFLLPFGVQLSHSMVRNFGHLAEYMLLGFWLVLTLRVYTGRVLAYASWPLLFGLSFAVADEFLQQFIAGRTSSVRDVVLDFIGVLFGGFVALFLILFVAAVVQSFQKKID